MPDAVALQYEVADIVGLDAWKIYEKNGAKDDGRHLIPLAKALGVSSGLIGDFLKGFIQPEALGKSAREYLAHSWENLNHDNVGGSADNGGFIDLMNAAKPAVVQATPQQIHDAEEALVASLRQFGLEEDNARAKAAQIRDSIIVSYSVSA